MKKILVIDGNSIINRAFFGIKPLTNKAGKHTNAIHGMLNIISRQLDAIKPDYAAVAFDLKAPTFRHLMFEEYKAGRNPTPPELLEQFPEAKACLTLMGIKVLELAGYEADDIQGTVAKMAHTAGEECESYVLSGDRDLLQLIDDKVTVLLATNTDTIPMHREEFTEKYGIAPELFVDMKALMGDSSDNIPGVRGIGEKTAASLIQKFSTLEGIYENIDDPSIAKGVRAKLIEGKENAYLSRELARIKTDVPLGLTLDELRIADMNRSGLYKKLTELELHAIIKKFKLTASDVSECIDCEAKPSADGNTEGTSTAADRIAAISANANDVLKISADTVAFIMLSESSFDISDGVNHFIFNGPITEIAPLIENCRSIICYDAKPLIHFFSKNGIKTQHGVRYLDLLLYAYVLNPGGGDAHLSSLASIFADVAISDTDAAADLLFALESNMRAKITADGMERVLDELELPLIPILASMEAYGFKIDTVGMLEFAEALKELAKDLEERIYVQALGEFNINSPKQLGEVLYVKLGLPAKAKKNKNGFSTDAETLEELRAYHPIVDDILEYRQVNKLYSTYAAALPKLADEDSRIHTEFKQALTATGRLSSADPNLQNIPIRTKMGREMRRYFICNEGYTLVDADYSQIELRLLAHISEDYNMSEAFRSGADIHRKTAAAVFSIPEECVNDEMRKRAKAVNFGIVYGISGFSLAKDIGTTTAEASKYIKSYLYNYPSIDSYLERVVDEAKGVGYTTTLFGRRRYIPELNAPNGMQRAFGKRIAMNAPIQGTAADIMKLAMIRVYERLARELPEAHLVMQVHDELIVEAPIEKAELAKHILKEEMENCISLSVPLTVDVTSGNSWLEQE
jgi:DNA polymerase-1